MMSTTTVMRPPRRLVFFLAGLGGGLLLTGFLAFLPPVQTAVVRRLLSAHPEWGLSVERIRILPGNARISGLKWRGKLVEGSAPEVEVGFDSAELVFGQAVVIRTLRARAWSAKVHEGVPTAARTGGSLAPLIPDFLRSAELPTGAELHGVDLEGTVTFPGRKIPAVVSLRGGGFAAGSEGRLELAARWESGDARLGSFGTEGVLRARMEDARRFSEVSARLESTVRSEAFPQGAALTTEARLFHERGGAGYRFVFATPRHAVLELTGELRPGSDRLRGAWRLDLTSADIAPLALGTPWPEFHARGDGAVESDAAILSPSASGRLSLDLSGLEVVRSELKAVGAVRLQAEFDAAWSADAISIARLSARLEGKRPVLGLEVTQPFVFRPSFHEWIPSRPGAVLADFQVSALPTAWLAPWVSGLELDGGDWAGELVASVSDGALSLRTQGEVTAGGLSLAKSGSRWLHSLEMAFRGGGKLEARGWQAQVDHLVLRAVGRELARVEARVGRLAGLDQPVKAEGTLRCDVAQAVRQPAAAGHVGLTGGEATLKFGLSLGRIIQGSADLRLERLIATPPSRKLPDVALEVRLETDAAGMINFSAPLRMTAGERDSDVRVSGGFRPRPGGKGANVEARLTGTRLHLSDGDSLAAALLVSRLPMPTSAGSVAVTPPWADWDGGVEVDIGEVVTGEALRLREVKGRLELGEGKVRMEALRGTVGERGRATLSGALAFEADRPEPFAAEVQVEVRDFDPGPLFRVASGGKPATLEGNFNLSSRLRGRAANLGSLAGAVAGEVLVSSRGGIFRGLPIKLAAGTAGAGRVAGMIAAAGSAFGSLTGRKDPPVIAGRAQAAAELAAGLGTIPFDQLSLVITRDAAHRTSLREFTLIAPELRLSGVGTLLERGAAGMLDGSLALEFSLRARGRQGDLLRHLGLLDPAMDDLGYAACRLPLRVTGTPARPDCGELAERLAALAAGKPGMAEKAGEFLQRIIGVSK